MRRWLRPLSRVGAAAHLYGGALALHLYAANSAWAQSAPGQVSPRCASIRHRLTIIKLIDDGDVTRGSPPTFFDFFPPTHSLVAKV